MSGSKLQKINKQHEKTWTKLHQRLTQVRFDFAELFSPEVKEFIKRKATSLSSNTGYLVPALLTTTSFVASMKSRILTNSHEIPANIYSIIVGPPTTGKTQSITTAAQNPMQCLQKDMDLPDFLIKKVSSSSGFTKILNETQCAYMVSSEIYDVLHKLLKSDEENATGDAQLLCELFSAENITFKYATEKVRTILANTPFSILGSTQMPLMSKLIARMDQGHGLLDRFLFNIPLCLRPTEEEKETAIRELQQYNKVDITELFNIMYNINNTNLYSFSEEANQTIKEINDDFIAQMNDAILKGEVPPKSKKPDLVMKLALSINIFDHVAKCLINGKTPYPPRHVIEQQTLQNAIDYIEHVDSQKELVIEVCKKNSLKIVLIFMNVLPLILSL